MTKRNPSSILVQNRKAFHNYFIEERFEAGIVLYGSEVKSIRAGSSNLADAYAEEDSGEILLLNAYIATYEGANRFNHAPRRKRKLLLHRREIKKLIGKITTKGYTLIPLNLHLSEKNLIKVEIGLAKGKKQYDKRESEKQRDWQRQKNRALQEKND